MSRRHSSPRTLIVQLWLCVCCWVDVESAPWDDVKPSDRKSDVSTTLIKFGGLGESEGCVPLKKQDNGQYECRLNRLRQRECKLTCNYGYTIPFNQYYPNEKLKFEERANYTCKKIHGLPYTWYPEETFDCVELRKPTAIEFHFYLEIPLYPNYCFPERTTDFRRSFLEVLSRRSQTHRLCRKSKVNCHYDMSVKCMDTTWKIAIKIWEKFKKKILTEWADELNRTFLKDLKLFVVRGMTGGPVIDKGERAVRVVCPSGTRLGSDLICHGCSVGHYMNENMMECQPCPRRYFQDENLQTTCKACPKNTPGSEIGARHITSCYSINALTQRTELLTAAGFITSVVAVVAMLLALRYNIHDELFEPEPKELIDLGVALGSRQHSFKRATVAYTEDVDGNDTDTSTASIVAINSDPEGRKSGAKHEDRPRRRTSLSSQETGPSRLSNTAVKAIERLQRRSSLFNERLSSARRSSVMTTATTTTTNEDSEYESSDD